MPSPPISKKDRNHMTASNYISQIVLFVTYCATYEGTFMDQQDSNVRNSSDISRSLCYMSHVFITVLSHNHIWCTCLYCHREIDMTL